MVMESFRSPKWDRHGYQLLDIREASPMDDQIQIYMDSL